MLSPWRGNIKVGTTTVGAEAGEASEVPTAVDDSFVPSWEIKAVIPFDSSLNSVHTK